MSKMSDDEKYYILKEYRNNHEKTNYEINFIRQYEAEQARANVFGALGSLSLVLLLVLSPLLSLILFSQTLIRVIYRETKNLLKYQWKDWKRGVKFVLKTLSQ